jgi:hypothetical protein
MTEVKPHAAGGEQIPNWAPWNRDEISRIIYTSPIATNDLRRKFYLKKQVIA